MRTEGSKLDGVHNLPLDHFEEFQCGEAGYSDVGFDLQGRLEIAIMDLQWVKVTPVNTILLSGSPRTNNNIALHSASATLGDSS